MLNIENKNRFSIINVEVEIINKNKITQVNKTILKRHNWFHKIKVYLDNQLSWSFLYLIVINPFIFTAKK